MADKKKVLVVEDNPKYLGSADRIDSNYHVLRATNFKEAHDIIVGKGFRYDSSTNIYTKQGNAP